MRIISNLRVEKGLQGSERAYRARNKWLALCALAALFLALAVTAANADERSDDSGAPGLLDEFQDGWADSDPGVEAFAKEWGIDTSEAAARLNRQDSLVMVASAIAQKYPDEYAGASFERGDQTHLTINVSGSGGIVRDDVQRELDRRGIARSSVTVVEDAASLTDAALEQLAEDTHAALKSAGWSSDYSLQIDPASRQITIGTEEPDELASLVDSTPTLEDLGIETQYRPTYRQTSHTCVHVNGWLDGGRLYEIMDEDTPNTTRDCGGTFNSYCTTGFAVTRTGKQGILTAGHCGSAGGWTSGEWGVSMWANNYAEFTATRWYVNQTNITYADAQVRREVWGSSTLKNHVYRYTSGGTNHFQTISGLTYSHPSGTYICNKGGYSSLIVGHYLAYNCGYITGAVDPDGSGPHSIIAFSRVDVTWHGPVRGGDSGGPVWAGSTAYGILTGFFNGYDYVYNEVAYALSYTGATLYTG